METAGNHRYRHRQTDHKNRVLDKFRPWAGVLPGTRNGTRVPDIKTKNGIRRQGPDLSGLCIGYARTQGTRETVTYQGAKRKSPHHQTSDDQYALFYIVKRHSQTACRSTTQQASGQNKPREG